MDNTQDLSKFGSRELGEAGQLLTALSERNFEQGSDLGEGVKVEFNMNSGNVFLVDEDYRVAMLNEGKLENWLNCSVCGEEGFRTEVEFEDDYQCKACK